MAGLRRNRDFGIRVLGTARVAISGCQVNGTGFRVGAATNNVANPGNGIEFQQTSSGLVCDSVITGSFGAGLKNSAKKASAVRTVNTCLFDNNPDTRRDRSHNGNDD